MRKRFTCRPRLQRAIPVGLIMGIFCFAALLKPPFSRGDDRSDSFSPSRPTVKLSRDSSLRLSDSSNFSCVTAKPHEVRSTARVVAAFGFDRIDGNKTKAFGGNKTDAILVNAGLTAGRFGKGIDLNGRDAYLRVENPAWPRGDYTYAAWVFPRLVRGWSTILEIQALEGGGVEVATAPGGHIEVWSSGKLRLRNGIALQAVGWNYVAVTRSDSLITVFQDGVPQRAGRDQTVFDFSNCPALIGVDADLGCAGKLNGFFSGVIDELRVYDCAISVDDIRLLMSVPVDRNPN